MFHEGDLQSGVALALQQSKAVLCFVQDQSETSRQWEDILREPQIAAAVTDQAVALRLEAGSQEAGFLSPICPINSTPAIVVIKNARLQQNLQSAEISIEDLDGRLRSGFYVQNGDEPVADPGVTMEEDAQRSGSEAEYLDLQPAPGQMRLPNNAYDALRNHTQKLLDEGTSPAEVFQTQLSLLDNIPIFHDEVKRLQGDASRELSEYARSRLLRLPAVGLRIPGPAKSANTSTAQAAQPSSPVPPTNTSNSNAVPAARPANNAASPPDQATSETQKAQRTEYIKMQREREQKQRDERERIKAQIKADREERRRLDEIRKQGETAAALSSTSAGSAQSKPRSTEIRLQVRTFDGSTLRSTFQPSSTLSKDIRPWIDANSNTTAPYNLKIILTPLPNRNIEASEEEQELRALGVVGSCTLVMVPVKGYVESYTGSTSGGLLGAAVSGGYNLVSGTAGMVFGGVKSMLGYNQDGNAATASTPGSARGQDTAQNPTPSTAGKNVRTRTLADQRAEDAKRDQQFYNGNQLNFEPNKDDDKRD
ncbi:hypothetical protein LTR10_017617 [Elasticomyces elasticus]|uniref:UBX domain-containing protein n=1 Tax=Exophiala sideris TaxID=1016849 RepID=A0ABR0JP46_9EURO|nr:hypothetical protein LTR10_017617 [Elasticomyces elasticus]KAK5038262.1 hypothetical protein LTS07_001732 [Exophiala sideris]KAK5044246.1 hypothetical protein LTR13_000602 [Exophiala sideris]KAK5067746.1 hypothetical protein LTR69_001735 [Exophiala sideris]KAK5184014.1 hypothetical protein LTR44_003519 [Eurotiomycetes sp. CCFEE 6388]